jgi:hypothetical protein
MNTITLPKNQYMQLLSTQEKLRGDLTRLEKIVSFFTQDELSPKYIAKLSRIEKGLSLGRGVKFKNKSEVKEFFNSL